EPGVAECINLLAVSISHRARCVNREIAAHELHAHARSGRERRVVEGNHRRKARTAADARDWLYADLLEVFAEHFDSRLRDARKSYGRRYRHYRVADERSKLRRSRCARADLRSERRGH